MSISSHLYISVTSSVLAGFSFLLLQRSIDIWSSVLPLRVRVLFDNAKWAYPGGFSEEKEVYF